LIGNIVEDNGSSSITGSTVSNATLTGNHDAIGGLVGAIETANATVINGCTVSSIGINQGQYGGKYGAGGLVGVISNAATISNCNVVNLTLPDDDMGDMGGLIGRTNEGGGTTTITNSHVSGLTANNMGGNCGGFMGIASSGTNITNCSVTGAVLEARGTAGGFIGWRRPSASGTISNCQAYATVKTITGASWADILGGFIGANDGGGTISNCLFVGTVDQGNINSDHTVIPQVGGFVGRSKATAGSNAYSNCAAIGYVHSNEANTGNGDAGIGGFAGTLVYNSGYASNCFFSGTVSGQNKVGGFAGVCQGGTMISTCYAHATVEATGNTKLGGLVGWRTAQDASLINNSYFKGSINKTGGEVGAFCGRNDGNDISGCAQTLTGINAIGTGSGSITSVAVADLQKLSSYTNMSGYTNQEGATYPYFSNQSAPVKSTLLSKTGNTSGELFNPATKQTAYGSYNFIDDAINTTSGLFYNFITLPATYNVLNYETSKMVSYPVGGTKGLLIKADETKSATTDYDGGDIIIYSDDASTGQLTGIASGGLTLTSGAVVKLIKAFNPGRWYPIGFPFAIQGAFCEYYRNIPNNGRYGDLKFWTPAHASGGDGGDFWMKKHSSPEDFTEYVSLANAVEANKGYIIQFPPAFKDGDVIHPVTFTSVVNPTVTVHSTKNTTTFNSEDYNLVANPSLANIQGMANARTHYAFVLEHNNFDRTDGIDLKPFEAVVYTHEAYTGTLRSALFIDPQELPTSIENTLNSSDPVVSVRYYNLQGVEEKRPQRNQLYIVKKTYASQKTEVVKTYYTNN
jgi:hypothetical protein